MKIALFLLLATCVHAAELDAYAGWLARLQATVPDRDRRIIAWAVARLGTPYVLDAQGEGAGRDADPLITAHRLDCTIFTLQAAASADARDRADLEALMKQAN